MKKTLGMISLSILLLAGCQTPTSDTDNTGEQGQTVDAQQQVEAQPQQSEKDEQEKQDEADAQAFDALSDNTKILLYTNTLDERLTEDDEYDSSSLLNTYYEIDGDDIYIKLNADVGGTYAISHVKRTEKGIKPIQLININHLQAYYYHADDITHTSLEHVNKSDLYKLYKAHQEIFDRSSSHVKMVDDIKDDFFEKANHSQIHIREENEEIEGKMPKDLTAEEKYDALSFEDQMVLNAYSLIFNSSFETDEEDRLNETEQLPDFISPGMADISTLYYTVEGSDAYYFMTASNGAKHLMAHAILTDDGIIPVQVTGYDITEGLAFGENNLLTNQELLTKNDLYYDAVYRLDHFRDQMADEYQPAQIRESHYVYLEFLAAMRNALTNDIITCDENEEDYRDLQLVMTAFIDRVKPSVVKTITYPIYIQTEYGYDISFSEGAIEEYHITDDMIYTVLPKSNTSENQEYPDGTNTASYSINKLQDEINKYHDVDLPLLIYATHSQEINAMREAADGESGLRLID